MAHVSNTRRRGPRRPLLHPDLLRPVARFIHQGGERIGARSCALIHRPDGQTVSVCARLFFEAGTLSIVGAANGTEQCAPSILAAGVLSCSSWYAASLTGRRIEVCIGESGQGRFAWTDASDAAPVIAAAIARLDHSEGVLMHVPREHYDTQSESPEWIVRAAQAILREYA